MWCCIIRVGGGGVCACVCVFFCFNVFVDVACDLLCGAVRFVCCFYVSFRVWACVL